MISGTFFKVTEAKEHHFRSKTRIDRAAEGNTFWTRDGGVIWSTNESNAITSPCFGKTAGTPLRLAAEKKFPYPKTTGPTSSNLQFRSLQSVGSGQSDFIPSWNQANSDGLRDCLLRRHQELLISSRFSRIRAMTASSSGVTVKSLSCFIGPPLGPECSWPILSRQRSGLRFLSQKMQAMVSGA